MPYPTHLIHVEPRAPVKPLAGMPCNGCGVCCLVEPCPLGVVLSGTRVGACAALRWNDAEQQYRCGAIVDTHSVVRAALPLRLRWMAPALTRLVARLAHRWIAAGVGCDSTLEPSSVASLSVPPAT